MAGGLAAGLALLLAGCGTGPKTNGPFGNSNAPYSGGQCIPVPPGDVATIAAKDFPNPGRQARIDNVTLVGAHDLRLVAAWAVPITGTDLMGVFAGYPPYGIQGKNGFPGVVPGVLWDRRQRADGAKIPHTPGQDTINLVLVVKASGVEGTSKTVYVDYESGGNHYRLDMRFFMKVFNGVPDGCK